jgi:thiol-disulfide isomerase/thioredoxin
VVSSDDLFANWADTPSITTATDGSLLVHWAQKSGEAVYAYDVRLALKRPGQGWKLLGAAHDDGTETEHGFVSAVPEGTGFRIFWLDGRNTGKEKGGPMTLRTSLVTDTIEARTELDRRVCDCCPTGAAMGPNGPLVVYRDRGEKERRDIAIVRVDETGHSTPMSVHTDGWVTPGCPVNGPQVIADGERVMVAWYTAADEIPRVRVSQSSDGGRSFGAPIDIDAQAPLGRVGLAWLPNGDAVVSWIGGVPIGSPGDDSAATIRLARVSREGHVGSPFPLATVAASRASGFPRVRGVGDDLVVVWTHVSEPGRAGTQLRALTLPWSLLKEPSAARTSEVLPGRDGGAVGSTVGLEARTLDGKAATLASLRGEVVLLNIWATWCKPCREELPALESIRKKHPGLRIVTLSVDAAGDVELVRTFSRTTGLDALWWHDPGGASSAFLGANSLPLTVLIDTEGRIVWRHEGPIDAADAGLLRALSGR